jgi:hypothetical protein
VVAAATATATAVAPCGRGSRARLRKVSPSPRGRRGTWARRTSIGIFARGPAPPRLRLRPRWAQRRRWREPRLRLRLRLLVVLGRRQSKGRASPVESCPAIFGALGLIKRGLGAARSREAKDAPHETNLSRRCIMGAREEAHVSCGRRRRRDDAPRLIGRAEHGPR